MNRSTSHHAASVVAGRLGLVGPVELLRVGANAVFRVGDAVLRVTDTEIDVGPQLALASWLAEQDIPVPRPLTDAVTVEGMQVTVWEYIDGHDRPIDYRQLGEVVARLHALSPARVSEQVQLPWCGSAAWLQVSENLTLAGRAGVVSDEDIGLLEAAVHDLAGWQDEAREDPLVVCHGDVHSQNALMHGDRVVILDWDSICLGPAAWDHAALLTWADRWGGAPGEYAAFAAGYGADLSSSPVAQILARVRLIAPTINMIIRGGSSETHAEEARLRMRYWRGEQDPPMWNPQ